MSSGARVGHTALGSNTKQKARKVDVAPFNVEDPSQGRWHNGIQWRGNSPLWALKKVATSEGSVSGDGEPAAITSSGRTQTPDLSESKDTPRSPKKHSCGLLCYNQPS